MSSGEQVRDHASVRDIARGVVAASLLPAPASKPRVFNLGSGECRSLREVVLDVTKQLAIPVEIQFGERPRLPDEPMFMVANTTLGTKRAWLDGSGKPGLRSLAIGTKFLPGFETERTSTREMNDPELSIVIPAYEEAESLSQILPVLQARAKSLTPNFEILVVDTMQPRDSTPALCQQLG